MRFDLREELLVSRVEPSKLATIARHAL
jgi:hypothetical protein